MNYWSFFYRGPMRRHLYTVYLLDAMEKMSIERVRGWCRLDVIRIMKEQHPDRLIYEIMFVR